MNDVDLLKNHGQILRMYQSRVSLKRDGREFVGKCPIHSEKTGSFKVYQDKNTWIWKCFGCNAAGNIFQLIQQTDKIPFTAAVEKVREFIGEKWKEVDETFHPISEEKTYKTIPLDQYSKLEENFSNSDAAKKWMADRGIDYETAKNLRIGYRRDIGSLAGESNSDVADKGWLAFPCVDGGTVLSIKYRSIVRKAFVRQVGMGNALFGAENIDALEPVFLVEGEIDALSLEQAGFRAVSLPSASVRLTPEMKTQLMQADSIILAGDNDSPGQDAMNKIWNELEENTFLLQWPDGMKDANEVFLNKCGGDKNKFRMLVKDLAEKAKSVPMPNVYSLQESMANSDRTDLSNHPNRFRFPWPSVDKMAILLPGSVASIMATNTKMGKTQFSLQATLYAAMQHNEVVLNYQCELGQDEISNIVAAHILRQNRNHLGKAHYQKAAAQLTGVKYYVGRNPTLTTVGPVLDLIEKAVKRLGATVVVLDHLHFITRNSSNEISDQADAMQRLKNMAVRYGLKVIVIGQPRKANQGSKGRLVHITDWKGSETGTSDADAIIAIHRQYVKIKDPQNPPKDDYEPETDIHLLGARSKGDGPTYAKLLFMGEIATFEEISHDNGTDTSRNQDDLVI